MPTEVGGPCVSSGTIQTCGVRVLAVRSTSTALNNTHLPSGEGTGSPTRLRDIMSSKVKGCLVCAIAARQRNTEQAIKMTRRMGASGKMVSVNLWQAGNKGGDHNQSAALGVSRRSACVPSTQGQASPTGYQRIRILAAIPSTGASNLVE